MSHSFGSVSGSVPGTGPKPGRRHALAGNGPVVDRARQALRMVAEQFGAVTGTGQTEVRVRTADGIELTLSYDPGNYVFSRVYNLTVSTRLPAGSGAPDGVRLVHRGQRGGMFAADRGSAAKTDDIDRLNAVAASHLATVDMLASTVADRRLTLTPMGGSYVWVLIPPVFKATAFPPGEPSRLLDLIRAIRAL